jgi:wee1-like protein kinase
MKEFKGKHNVSRFKQEFVELGVLGMGSFGTVYKCKNNLGIPNFYPIHQLVLIFMSLDEKIYAIKRSNRCIAGMADEFEPKIVSSFHAILDFNPRSQLIREVQAHANIKNQEHIVRYFSAWEEDDHMLIQNEYCDGLYQSRLPFPVLIIFACIQGGTLRT